MSPGYAIRSSGMWSHATGYVGTNVSRQRCGHKFKGRKSQEDTGHPSYMVSSPSTRCLRPPGVWQCPKHDHYLLCIYHEVWSMCHLTPWKVPDRNVILTPAILTWSVTLNRAKTENIFQQDQGNSFARPFKLTVHLSGFGGLEVACWPLVPKFAGSNPAEAVGFF